MKMTSCKKEDTLENEAVLVKEDDAAVALVDMVISK